VEALWNIDVIIEDCQHAVQYILPKISPSVKQPIYTKAVEQCCIVLSSWFRWTSRSVAQSFASVPFCADTQVEGKQPDAQRKGRNTRERKGKTFGKREERTPQKEH
jgi:hypothetical protein